MGLARPCAECSAPLLCLKPPRARHDPHTTTLALHQPSCHLCGKVTMFPRLQWWTQEKSPQGNESVFPGLLPCLWDARKIGSGPSWSDISPGRGTLWLGLANCCLWGSWVSLEPAAAGTLHSGNSVGAPRPCRKWNSAARRSARQQRADWLIQQKSPGGGVR